MKKSLLNLKYRKKAENRLLLNTEYNPNNGCLEWTSYFKNGYPLFKVRVLPELPYRDSQATHISYMLFKTHVIEPIPRHLIIMHSCDNPPCVNPAHLFLDTRAENNKDRDRKGRTYRGFGEENTNAKLTTEMVRYIKGSLLQDKNCENLIYLADQFVITVSNIKSIRDEKTWKHVTA